MVMHRMYWQEKEVREKRRRGKRGLYLVKVNVAATDDDSNFALEVEVFAKQRSGHGETSGRLDPHFHALIAEAHRINHLLVRHRHNLLHVGLNHRKAFGATKLKNHIRAERKRTLTTVPASELHHRWCREWQSGRFLRVPSSAARRFPSLARLR